MLYMTQVFPNIYIETDYWNAKNTDGTIFLNYIDACARPIDFVCSSGLYEIKMYNKDPTWEVYGSLFTQTTQIIKSHLLHKKTIQIIGTNNDDTLSIVAALLVSISTTGLNDILEYLSKIMNVEINENSNAMNALLVYELNRMVNNTNPV